MLNFKSSLTTSFKKKTKARRRGMRDHCRSRITSLRRSIVRNSSSLSLEWFGYNLSKSSIRIFMSSKNRRDQRFSRCRFENHLLTSVLRKFRGNGHFKVLLKNRRKLTSSQQNINRNTSRISIRS